MRLTKKKELELDYGDDDLDWDTATLMSLMLKHDDFTLNVKMEGDYKHEFRKIFIQGFDYRFELDSYKTIILVL